jgi:hypothetical protein
LQLERGIAWVVGIEYQHGWIMSQVVQAVASVLSYLIGGLVWLQGFVALLLAAIGFTATTQGVYVLFNSLLFTAKQSFTRLEFQRINRQETAKGLNRYRGIGAKILCCR